MAVTLCPFCGSNDCLFEVTTEGKSAYKVHCVGLSADFYIGTEIINLKNEDVRNRFLNLVVERLIRSKLPPKTTRDYLWFFNYEENADSTKEDDKAHYVNLADDMKLYPSNIVQRVERSLLNIVCINPKVGKHIYLTRNNTLNQHMLFCESNSQEQEYQTILGYLKDIGYIEGDLKAPLIMISYSGWEKVEELTKRFSEIKQGFIAMSYKEELKPIMDSFRSAILASGYKPQVIGDKEHNNQIVPEMFYEIERSKFMVVDVSEPNLGAYYEAGYAQALGKEVIVCCSKEVFDDQNRKPHFDIAQKPIIVWISLPDLEEKLKRRIEATVR